MTDASNASDFGRLALVFPGQGSQFPGMAKDLVRDSSTAARLLERADEVLGYSLSKIMLSGGEEDLNRTVHTQPAVFVYSMALLEVLRERASLSPVIAGGHSLGEISALCAAGVLSFDSALELIRVRAEGMEKAQPAGTCAMAAIIGPKGEEVRRLVEEHRGEDVLEAANYNAPDQVVVSGNVEAVGRLVAAAAEMKRTKAVMLPVSSAFHTVLMRPAQQLLREKLQTIELGKPLFPVVANVNGKVHPSGDATKHLLVDQLVSPVLWEDCVQTMKEAGSEVFVEVGPGKVLTGLMRRIDRRARTMSVSTIEAAVSFGEASP